MEYLFIATQAQNQLWALQEPLGEIREENLLAGVVEPKTILVLPLEPDLLLN